jgi:hypothetical protein
MIRPKFSAEVNGNGNWNVVMTRSTKSGAVLQSQPVAAELSKFEARTLANDMQKASDDFARALCEHPDNRTEDDITLTFSF